LSALYSGSDCSDFVFDDVCCNLGFDVDVWRARKFGRKEFLAQGFWIERLDSVLYLFSSHFVL